MQTNWKLGLGFSLLTAIMWGLLPLALKGLLDAMDPITITWYRFISSAVIAMLWYGHRSQSALKNLLSKQHRLLVVLAIAGLLGNYLLYLLGLNYITPSAAQLLIQVAPLLLLLGSVILFKENFSRWQWLGVLGFCSGMLLFFHLRLSSIVITDKHYLVGVALIIAASITWAGYGLAQKQLLKFENSNDILLILYLAGTLCFLPFSNPSQILALKPLELGLVAFVSLNTIIAYGSFGYAMTHWEASRVSAAITLAPLLTLVFVELANHWQPGSVVAEPMDWLSWLGGFLVVIGATTAALASSSTRA
jgi:drug/metabolite transporter (DMT)-like permease